MHYHVRALVYEQTEDGFRTVRVAKMFARKFGVPAFK
jgi:hypothetical protein